MQPKTSTYSIQELITPNCSTV